MCSKYVSQKGNEAIDNYQQYKLLLNLKMKIVTTLDKTKIYILGNLSKAKLIILQL